MSANHIKGQIKSDSLSLTLGNNSAAAGKLTITSDATNADKTLTLTLSASSSFSLAKNLAVTTGNVTLAGNAAGSSVTLPTSGTMARTEGTLAQFALTSSSELRTLISDETGTGSLVFATSPTLVTPNLGTPSSLTLTNATGLPVSTGISGLGTNVAAFLADPTSANLAAAVTNEQGTGNVVFSNSPSLTSPTITGGSVLGASVSLPASSGGGLLNLFWDEIQASNYGLTLKVHSANRTLDLTGDLTLAHNLTTSGYAITLTSTATTNVTLPQSGTLATLAGSETLSNKTLTAPNIGAATGTSLTASSSTLSLATASNGNLSLTAHGSGNVALSSTTGKVTADRPVEVSGTSSYVKFPSLTTTQRDALSSPAAGMTVFNTDVSKLQNYSGSSWTSVGGGGTGGINYLADVASELSDASVGSWVQYDEGASATPVDGTGDAGGSGDNQLSAPAVDATTKLRGTNSLKLVKAAANAQGEGYSCAYTSHEIDKNSLQEITFNFDCSNANYTAGDVVVYIYDVTNATLITPSQTSVPAGKGTFKALFVNGNSNSYRLVLHYAGTNTSAQTLYFDNFIVGPVREGNIGGVPVQEWTSYTPTITGNGSKGTVVLAGKYRRIGDTAEIKIFYSGNTVAAGAGATIITFSIPTGLTINSNSTPYGIGSNGTALGTFNEYGIKAAANYSAEQGVYAQSSTTMALLEAGAGTVYTQDDLNVARVTEIVLKATVPISEWAGETVAMANSRVEYASNSSTSDTNDTTSFVYGPAGSSFPSSSFSNPRKKRVRFQTPILETDTLSIQVNYGDGKWYDLTAYEYDTGLQPFMYQNGVTYGVGIQKTTVNSTDFDVVLGRYYHAGGATFGAAGSDWSATTGAFKWRVCKSSNPLGIGTGLATSTTPGAVGGWNGAAPAAGYIGEVKTVDSTTSVGTSATTLATISLTTGTWLLSACYRVGADATARYLTGSINNTLATHDTTSGRVPITDYNTGSGNGSVTIPNRVVTISTASQDWYVIGAISTTSGLSSTSTHIMALRIA